MGSEEGQIQIFKMVAVEAILDFQSNNLTNFDLQVITIPSTKFPVSWTFCSGVEVQNRFSRWQSWQPIRQVALILSTMFRFNWHFHSGEEVQNRFSKAGHLGFWIRAILVTFYLQVATVLPTKF